MQDQTKQDQVQSTESPQQKIKIVIDANALIKQIRVPEILKCQDNQEFKEKYEAHTLEDVKREIRDENARKYLETIPYELTIHQTEKLDPENFHFVSDFAKETGDFKSLSQTDIKVIAFGVQLIKQSSESHKLHLTPKPLTEFKPKRFQKDYEKIDEEEFVSDEEMEEVEEEQEKQEVVKEEPIKQQEDEWNTITETTKGGRKNKKAMEFQVKVMKQKEKEKKEEEQKQAEAIEQQKEETEQDVEENGYEIDNEEEGGEWVTPDNLFKHIGGGESKEVKKEEEEQVIQSVKFVTSDFAMQNVIIQLGFQLLALDGRRITRVKRFKLLCRACQKLNLNVEKEFCEFCGSHTLSKVSVYINEKGDITYFRNPKRKINLKGTKYSIPKPKHGRNNKDLILREDELLVGEKWQQVKRLEKEQRLKLQQINDTIQGNYWQGGEGYGAQVSNLLYENGAKGGVTGSKHGEAKLQIGYGRKNPNVVKKTSGRRK